MKEGEKEEMSAQIAAIAPPYERKSLTEAVVRKCPSCGAEISLPVGTVSGELITCPDCGEELEIVFDPSKIDFSAINKGHPEFDPANVDRTVSPTLIPGPRTEEDSGE